MISTKGYFEVKNRLMIFNASDETLDNLVSRNYCYESLLLSDKNTNVNIIHILLDTQNALDLVGKRYDLNDSDSQTRIEFLIHRWKHLLGKHNKINIHACKADVTSYKIAQELQKKYPKDIRLIGNSHYGDTFEFVIHGHYSPEFNTTIYRFIFSFLEHSQDKNMTKFSHLDYNYTDCPAYIPNKYKRRMKNNHKENFKQEYKEKIKMILKEKIPQPQYDIYSLIPAEALEVDNSRFTLLDSIEKANIMTECINEIIEANPRLLYKRMEMHINNYNKLKPELKEEYKWNNKEDEDKAWNKLKLRKSFLDNIELIISENRPKQQIILDIYNRILNIFNYSAIDKEIIIKTIVLWDRTEESTKELYKTFDEIMVELLNKKK